MEETAVVQAKQPINIAMTHKGIEVKTYQEVMQLAALMHNSGLAPKSLDSVNKVAIAMMMAIEVGMPVITGIQNIAVINNRAGIWGDATLSLVQSSGLMETGYPKERIEGSPYTDTWTFYCTVKRKGCQEVTGSFSWAEAKKAGFDNPQLKSGGKDIYSPWTRFPRRMMQWKARQWVYRDTFGDVLKGMKMAEELDDYIEMDRGNGDRWELHQEPEPASYFDIKEFIKGLNEDGIELMQFSAFVGELTRHYKKSIEEIHNEIGNDPQGFTESLKAWIAKNGHEKTGDEKEETKKEKPVSEAEAVRTSYINLKSAGFSSWVWKNKPKIPFMPEECQNEIREKWEKLYSGTPFPCDVKEEKADIEPDQAIEQPQTIPCPDRNGKDRPIADCELCPAREGCPEWEE